MSFLNPFPESCCFAVEKNSLALNGIHPVEIKIGNSFLSASRRTEFFTGRRCAHFGMIEAGYPNLPILRDQSRSPIWPFSIIGSITHNATIAAGIVSKKHQSILGLGIDIEDLSREIRTNITRHTLTPWEIEKWSASSPTTPVETKIIFSIKEAIYKCFFPMYNIYLGFQDAEITELTENKFKASLLKNPFPYEVKIPIPLTGKVFIDSNIIFAALKFTKEQLKSLMD